MTIPATDQRTNFAVCWQAALLLYAGSCSWAWAQSYDAALSVRDITPILNVSVREPDVLSTLPSDAELERLQAKVAKIIIIVDDVFDETLPAESGAGYRWANRLHTSTRVSTIKPQLLFAMGSVYSRRLLDETERNLRARRYLVEAAIVPTTYDPSTNTVALQVRVRDVWTLTPGTTFGRSGGVNQTGVQLEDNNFLGQGKSIAVGYRQDVDRSAWRFSYTDENLLDSHWNFKFRYNNASDGTLHGATLEQPFYAWDTRWSYGISSLHDQRTDSYYDLGKVVYDYGTEEHRTELYVGYSSGLHGNWVNRWRVGFVTEERAYAVVEPDINVLLPENIRLAYPWIGFERSEDRYLKDYNRNQAGRTEDIYIGRSMAVKLGYAAPVMGADRYALMFTVNAQGAAQITDRRILLAKADFEGRVEDDHLRDTLLTAEVRYDVRQAPRWLLTTTLAGANGTELDVSKQVQLGGDNGLRGYPLRYLSGKSRLLWTLEQRYYTDWTILRLLSVGAAAFFDAGRVWGNPPNSSDSATLGTLKDVGFGLRLGNLRSSLGGVFHLDVAYALDGNADISKLQFSITTRASF